MIVAYGTIVAFSSRSFSNYGDNYRQYCIITNHDNTICKHSKRNNKVKNRFPKLKVPIVCLLLDVKRYFGAEYVRIFGAEFERFARFNVHQFPSHSFSQEYFKEKSY